MPFYFFSSSEGSTISPSNFTIFYLLAGKSSRPPNLVKMDKIKFVVKSLNVWSDGFAHIFNTKVSVYLTLPTVWSLLQSNHGRELQPGSRPQVPRWSQKAQRYATHFTLIEVLHCFFSFYSSPMFYKGLKVIGMRSKRYVHDFYLSFIAFIWATWKIKMTSSGPYLFPMQELKLIHIVYTFPTPSTL